MLAFTGQVTLAGELELGADRPSVPVETRAEGRNFIRLPNLQYTIRVQPICNADRSPSRLSLSVADTRIVLNEAALTAEAGLDIPLQIPSSQIAPVAVEGFCLADISGPTDGAETMVVPSVLSIQASLLCTGESGNEMIYASTALDVMLDCLRPQDTGKAGDASITSRQVPVEKSNRS